VPNTKPGVIRCGPNLLIINQVVTGNIAGFIILLFAVPEFQRKAQNFYTEFLIICL
jgi:hypothetical protein